jgi:rare lipoprotein A
MDGFRNIVIKVLVVVFLGSISFAQAEVASVYGGRDGLCGSMTASGERFNCSAMTAAHRTLPFGSWIRVTHAGRSVTLRVNDRGPWVKESGQYSRAIDLSPAAAARIRCGGVCEVEIETTTKPYQPTNDTFRGTF